MTAIQSRGYVKKGESEGKNRDVLELTLENNQIAKQTVQEKSGATICKDLKAMTNDKPLCPCPQCVYNGIEILGECLGME